MVTFFGGRATVSSRRVLPTACVRVTYLSGIVLVTDVKDEFSISLLADLI